MNGSSGTQGQNIPKFRIVPGRQLGEPPPVARTISRTSSWNSNSNSQDGTTVNLNRPSTSTIVTDISQNASFVSIKEETSFYNNSPSPSQPQQQHHQHYPIKEEGPGGAVRYGHPSTSSVGVPVSANGNHQTQQPVATSIASSINGSIPSSIAQTPLPGQLPNSSNGIRQLPAQFSSVHQHHVGNNTGLVNSSVSVQQPVAITSASSSNYQHQPVLVQQPAAPPQQTQTAADPVMKCARFFRTLIQLSNQPDHQQNSGLVTNLVREVINGSLEVEQFTSRLQNALGSKAQPHLQPFLQKTLPALRETMRQRELVLDGINLNQIVGMNPVDSLASTFSSPESLPGTIGNSAVAQARIPSAVHSNASGIHVTQPTTQYQSSSPLTMRPDSAGQMQPQRKFVGFNGSPLPSSIMNTPSASFVTGSSLVLVQSEPTEPATPASVSGHSDGHLTPSVPLHMSVSSAVTVVSAPTHTSVPTAAASVSTSTAPPEQIQTKPFTNFQMLNQYRVLSIDVLLSRIRSVMPEAAGTGSQLNVQLPADEHALTLLAQAAEYRLRKVLTHLSTTAEHRSEQLRSNPHYKLVGDFRKQLKFVEEVDKIEQERRENREKEALIRMSKSKGKDKDTLEKAKQIQQADQLAARNRDANAAAMAALGGTKKRKLDDPLDQSIAHGLSAHPQSNRPRTKRVLTKDLMLILSQDRLMKNSKLRTRLMLTSSAKDQSM